MWKALNDMEMNRPGGSQRLWSLQEEQGQWTLRLHGHWSAELRDAPRQRGQSDGCPSLPPSAEAVLRGCPSSLQQLTVDTGALDCWDSAMLPALLYGLRQRLLARGGALVFSPQDPSLEALMQLARGATEDGQPRPSPSWLERLGETVMGWERGVRAGALSVLICLGSLVRLCTGQACMRGRDLLDVLNESGTRALPIVTLVSLLVGSILAFVGALQLRNFGAEIYIAEMVGIAVAREMAAMMTAIVMAGRTGAAFAAHLATMQVNEEVDALKTLGVSPYEFLALPRVLALTLMMPLLYIYAAVVSMAGGLLVALMALGLEPAIYIQRLLDGVALQHFALGLLKSLFFGLLIGIVSCHVGLASGRSAAAVGQAATRAVVLSIVGIIVVDSLFAIVSTYTGV